MPHAYLGEAPARYKAFLTVPNHNKWRHFRPYIHSGAVLQDNHLSKRGIDKRHAAG